MRFFFFPKCMIFFQFKGDFLQSFLFFFFTKEFSFFFFSNGFRFFLQVVFGQWFCDFL